MSGKQNWIGTLFSAAALAVGALLLPARSDAAGLLIADGGAGGKLEIKEQAVKVTINNGIAVTEVDQTFVNTENRIVEALYTFPVPRSASVSNFSMWIGGKEMVGEVLEKTKARDIYNSYKQVRRDPGLLEQTSYRTFEMRIFPIAARAEQRVRIVYYQELDFDADQASYVYPLSTNTRNDIDSQTTGRFALNLDVKSEIPITELQSPSHNAEFATARHGDSYWQASLEQKAGRLNRDVVLQFKTARPKTGVDLVASRQSGEDGYFLLTLTAGEELKALNTAMDYVFVLDTSGSMNDDGKLDVSRKNLSAFISALAPEDRFELMSFNVAPETLFNKLEPAGDDFKKRAADFLANRRAAGGTVLSPALTTAYKYADAQRTLNVIILSDGLTEQTERAGLVKLIKDRPANSKVFCIGVGNDVNRPMLEQLSNDSGGLAAFISREDNFERAAAAFRRKLMRPAMTDLKIELAGAQAYDLEPRQLPNLYHGAPVRLYGRYKTDGPTKAAISANINGQPFSQTIELSLPKQEDSNPQIERMWASRRVDRLLKEADAAGSRTSVIDEVVRLGEGYSIASEYTSFLVLENDAEFKRWNIQRRNLLRMERDSTSARQLAASLDTMRAKASNQLGPAAIEKPVAEEVATGAKTQAPPSAPGQSPISSPRGHDLAVPGFGGGSGGGAIDPITLALFGSAGAALLIARKRRAATR